MPSTYTTNLGIEKIATGEQSGVWGSTTNTNLDIIDQAVNGIASITLVAAGDSGSPNSLAISNGAVSDGRNKFIEYTDGGDLGATAYVQLVPNDAEKIVIIRNSLSGGQSLIIFQGTYNASNDFEISNGKEVVLKFSGTGTGATVTQVFEDLQIGGLSADSATLTTADINGGTVDGAIIGGSSAAAGTFTTLTATTLGGALDANNENITNVDIDSGAIDGTTIGAAAAAAGTFTTLSATTLGSSLDANNQAITNVDINSGAIDGTTIGASSAAAGTFSSVTASTADINGGSIDGVSIGSTTPATSAAVDNISIDGNTISSTDTDGVINLTPDGTGDVNISNVDINGGSIDGTTIGASSATDITGTTITADTQFSGSGAGLSSGTVPLAALVQTGTLPAYDGSNLTSVSAPFTFVSQDMTGLYEKEFTGLPSGITEIIVFMSDLEYGGTNEPRIQLGYGSTTYQTATYLALVNAVKNSFERPNIQASPSGFLVSVGADTNDYLTSTLRLYKPTSNIFMADSQTITYEKTAGEIDSNEMHVGTCSGMVDLGNTLTAVKVDRQGGTSTYTSGTITLAYR